MSRYDPASIEPKWQERWEADHTFRTDEDPAKPKFYGLVMFPYPSGAGLHVGHPESYTAVDIVVRYKRARGFRVLHPMGWDAFGLPAERSAVREGIHPATITKRNVDNFRRQLKRLGFSYDWHREVDTSSPDYYRHTQAIFLELYKRGLAYLADVPVNWCPALGTVLANEEVKDGRYVETGDLVERKVMKQWMLKITAYAERLLEDLEGLDWPAGILEMQRNWIGKSEGAELRFATDAGDLVVYTTRPDTTWGCTFCVLAPEHPMVPALSTSPEVAAYVAAARARSDMERQLAAEKEKTGVFTGSYAVNPATGAKVPIWVADYVLSGYGTGAIMAVPGHDARDHAFARAHDLPIQRVVAGGDLPFEEAGIAVHSGPLDGFRTSAALPRAIAWFEQHGLGTRKVRYKLRDWLFSRQRYWGEPFPLVHVDDGSADGRVEVSEDLPVLLPALDDFRPAAGGAPPLARATSWVRTTHGGVPARRELNTMPQWAGSCWYWLRYMDARNPERPFDPEKERLWGPVDLYVGGVEHAVLHLLYARFWHKVLFDAGWVHTKEPFQRLFNQGMILAFSYRDEAGKYYHPSAVVERDGAAFSVESGARLETQIEKMSKSKSNVVNPDDIVAEYGADALRVYEMFMGPLDQVKPWQTAGVQGVARFLDRTWRLFVDDSGALRVSETDSPQVRRALHAAIKEATEGIEAMRFNTPIARMMELVNACKGVPLSRGAAERFALILHPWAPHLAEELWARLGHEGSIYGAAWPAWEEGALAVEEIEIAVQVQGKLRGTFKAAPGTSKEELLAAARAVENVARHIEGKEVVKEIVVPNKLVGFVVK